MRKRFRTLRRAWRFAMVQAAFQSTARLLPRRLGLVVMGFWGRLAHALLVKPRRMIDRNLELVFPSWTERQRRRFGRLVLIRLGMNVLDFLRLARMSSGDVRDLVRCQGLERFESAYRRGRGVLAVTGHAGNWELMAAYFAAQGFPVSVVARAHNEARWDRWIRGLRERHGVRVLDRDHDRMQIVRALKSGEIVGVLLDQATRVESVRVPFLGRHAQTPVGPARLAAKTGAALLPMVIQMDEDLRHTVTVGPEVRVGNGSSAAVSETTARCNEVLGELIMKRPEQWVWFHDRWR